MNMLSLEHVSKSFGSRQVLADLSFTVPEHTVYGFIGNNGAGKTTTMKLILGLIKRDGGEIFLGEEPVSYGQNRTNRLIGYLPDVPAFYPYMSAGEYLAFCGKISGMDPQRIRRDSERLLALAGLADSRDQLIQGFSRGMKQRLGIAQALLGQPKLLICDEPTSALDPRGRKEFLDILASVREHTTVLFSTHILADVERICDEIGILDQGKLAFSGTIEQIRALHPGNGFEIEFYSPEQAQLFARRLPGGEMPGPARLLYARGGEKQMAQAIRLLGDLALCPLRIERLEPTLENLFMEVIGR